eukprot:CAMPEP_0179115790 /NCGR_PEP_ID=MMETSP0796-20121207/54278_1 /TAXON_ID=73915 /ORGANISM="Pyrodinium bahamense, Strain pbaha01" /LENGTH=280 /DNA_ID=CAMNT_0020814045 /DNA_START=75 /DNA_END=917 /DNA_ORIENTATION=-
MLLDFSAPAMTQLPSEQKADAACCAARVDTACCTAVQPLEAAEDLTPSTAEPGSDESDVDCGAEAAEEEALSAPSPFAPEDTIIIFDWDDTILPSSWMQREGLTLDAASRPTSEQAAQLRALAQRAARTLRSAKRLGSVVVVTNAERGWIELSCHKFMPSLVPLLESLKIISARSAYEKLGVTSPVEWKCRAFQSECSSFYKLTTADRKRNVLSLGDSVNERSALILVTKDMQNCCTKSLKFMEQPDVVQLQREHELVSRSIPQIVGHDGSLDLRVQVSA